MSTLHFTAVIKQILPPEKDLTGQRPYVRHLYLVEEYDGGQYPERAILAVYDKDGSGSVFNKVLEKLGHFPAVEQLGAPGEPFELYFHLDASTGVSNKTGNPYNIMKPLNAWYFDKPEQHEKRVSASANEPCAYSIPGYSAAPAASQQPQFQQQPQQFQQPQYSQPQYGQQPSGQQPQYPGQPPF